MGDRGFNLPCGLTEQSAHFNEPDPQSCGLCGKWHEGTGSCGICELLLVAAIEEGNPAAKAAADAMRIDTDGTDCACFVDYEAQ